MMNLPSYGGWNMGKPNQYTINYNSRYGYKNSLTFSINPNKYTNFTFGIKFRF